MSLLLLPLRLSSITATITVKSFVALQLLVVDPAAVIVSCLLLLPSPTSTVTATVTATVMVTVTVKSVVAPGSGGGILLLLLLLPLLLVLSWLRRWRVCTAAEGEEGE